MFVWHSGQQSKNLELIMRVRVEREGRSSALGSVAFLFWGAISKSAVLAVFTSSVTAILWRHSSGRLD